MTLAKLIWICTCIFLISLLLNFLRLLNILGDEADIFTRWFSAVGLILLGVVVGVFISKKPAHVKGMLAPSLLFVLGFMAAPFIIVGVFMLIENALNTRINPIIFGIGIVVYLLLYMELWFWLKRKGIVKVSDCW